MAIFLHCCKLFCSFLFFFRFHSCFVLKSATICYCYLPKHNLLLLKYIKSEINISDICSKMNEGITPNRVHVVCIVNYWLDSWYICEMCKMKCSHFNWRPQCWSFSISKIHILYAHSSHGAWFVHIVCRGIKSNKPIDTKLNVPQNRLWFQWKIEKATEHEWARGDEMCSRVRARTRACAVCTPTDTNVIFKCIEIDYAVILMTNLETDAIKIGQKRRKIRFIWCTCARYAIASHEILIIHTITIKINAYLFWEWIMASSGSVESFSVLSRSRFQLSFWFCATLFAFLTLSLFPFLYLSAFHLVWVSFCICQYCMPFKRQWCEKSCLIYWKYCAFYYLNTEMNEQNTHLI